jgi:hypothetical protein
MQEKMRCMSLEYAYIFCHCFLWLSSNALLFVVNGQRKATYVNLVVQHKSFVHQYVFQLEFQVANYWKRRKCTAIVGRE